GGYPTYRALNLKLAIIILHEAPTVAANTRLKSPTETLPSVSSGKRAWSPSSATPISAPSVISAVSREPSTAIIECLRSWRSAVVRRTFAGDRRQCARHPVRTYCRKRRPSSNQNSSTPEASHSLLLRDGQNWWLSRRPAAAGKNQASPVHPEGRRVYTPID